MGLALSLFKAGLSLLGLCVFTRITLQFADFTFGQFCRKKTRKMTKHDENCLNPIQLSLLCAAWDKTQIFHNGALLAIIAKRV